VLAGVGTATQRIEPPTEGLDVIALMASATRAALADMAVSTIGLEFDEVLVPQGTWTYGDPARAVGELVGAGVNHSVRSELGVLQSALIHRACNRIASGDARCIAVVGGEAKFRSLQRSISELDDDIAESSHADSDPDECWEPAELVISRAEIDAGLVDAVSQYAMIENALRASDGLDIDTHRREIAALWQRFNAVAAEVPDAWFPEPRSAASIAKPGPKNRPLAFPYNKWHNSQWNVDQAAALIFTSAEYATELGLSEPALVYPIAAADSDAVIPVTERTDPSRFAAAEEVFAAVENHHGSPLRDLDIVDFYSCFPSAVRTQARALGIEDDATPTVTGGMTFGGGPFNNFVLQATAGVARRVRSETRPGLVSAVSGLLTKHGATLYSTTPTSEFRHVDCTNAVVAATARTPLDASFESGEPARVVTYTVRYDGQTPSEAVLVCETRNGRVIASGGRELADHATRTELIGTSVVLRKDADIVIATR
jgi:acetyl-CoA C-acetyltransferase